MTKLAAPEWRLRTLQRVQWASQYEKGYLASHFDSGVRRAVRIIVAEGLIEERRIPPKYGLSYFITPKGIAEIERLAQ
jgi:hypothetical protein